MARQKWIKIQDMNEVQSREFFKTSADFLKRHCTEIVQMLPMLQSTIDEGLDEATFERLRQILFYISERTSKANKRAWTCLYALKHMAGVDISLGNELKARAIARSKKNRENYNRIRNWNKTAPKNP